MTFGLRHLAIGLVLLSACAEEPEATDFTVDNREGFLAACYQPIEDPHLVDDVCQCTYDRIEEEMSFEELSQLDRVLQAKPDGPLPDDMIDIVSDCFIEAGELTASG